MKRTSYLLGIILSILIGTAFTSCSASKEASEEDLMNHRMAAQLISEQDFLIKGQRLQIKQKSFPAVSESTNFIMVSGDQAIVQVSPVMGGGPNGVGGFTVKGQVTGYEAKTTGKGDVNVRFHVQSISGSCDVMVKLIRETNAVTANITSTFRGGTATMYGVMVPNDDSVHVGRTRF